MKFYRVNDLVTLTGLSRSTIYRLVDKGEFPKPVKLSARVIGWEEEVLFKWKEYKISTNFGKIGDGDE